MAQTTAEETPRTAHATIDGEHAQMASAAVALANAGKRVTVSESETLSTRLEEGEDYVVDHNAERTYIKHEDSGTVKVAITDRMTVSVMG